MDLVGILQQDFPGRYDSLVPVAVHEQLRVLRISASVRHPDDLDAALEPAKEPGYEVEDARYKQLRSLRRMTGRALIAGDVIPGALAPWA